MGRLSRGRKDFWREDPVPVTESASGVPEKADSASSTEVPKRGPDSVAKSAPSDDHT